MDKKKKIVASAVFGVFVIVIVFFCKSLLFGSTEEEKRFDVSTPDVNEKEIKGVSKMKSYDSEIKQVGDTTSIIDLQKKKKSGFDDIQNFNPFKRGGNRSTNAKDLANGLLKEDRAQSMQQIDPELLALMQMQEQMMAQEASRSRSEGRATRTRNTASAPVKKKAAPAPKKELTLKDIRTKSENSGSFFQGAAGKTATKDAMINLTPCETVDQGVLIQGSTVAVRLKKAFQTQDPALYIPNGAVLYGKVAFTGQDRLQIDIESYRDGDKMKPVSLSIYDFDGREGVHLGVNEWPKIPSKVAKEVLNYVKQRGTQASTFGGGNDIDLGEAKDLAIISSLKEVSEELLERKKVFMPKKYNLWINTATTTKEK